MVIHIDSKVFRCRILGENFFHVEIIQSQVQIFEIVFRLVIWWEIMIVWLQCINFSLDSVLCLVEKWGKTAYKISHLFSLVNLFMKGNSLYLWSPSEIITVAYKLWIRFVKLMQFRLYYIHLILCMSYTIQVKDFITVVKCFML